MRKRGVITRWLPRERPCVSYTMVSRRQPLTVDLLRMRSFDFTSLPTGSSVLITLADRVDVTPYRSGSFHVRLHATELSTVAKDTQVVYVGLQSDFYTSSDPTREFLGASHATVVITPGMTVPRSLSYDLFLPLPPFLILRMQAEAGSVAFEPFRFTISASVTLHER